MFCDGKSRHSAAHGCGTWRSSSSSCVMPVSLRTVTLTLTNTAEARNPNPNQRGGGTMASSSSSRPNTSVNSQSPGTPSRRMKGLSTSGFDSSGSQDMVNVKCVRVLGASLASKG
eukprot:scaffold23443_cov56-Phaeocystis_antarctica.AAC.2